MSRLLILLLAMVAGAAGIRAEGPPEPAAFVRAGEVLRGSFEQERMLAGLDAPVRSQGRFVLAPGTGLIWRVDSPFEIVTVVTPDGLRQKIPGGADTAISAARLPALRDLFDLLGGSLAGDWSVLERRFRLTRGGDAGAWTVDMAPQREGGATMPFETIALKGGRFVDRVEMKKANGDSDRIVFREQAVTAGPPTLEEMKIFGGPVQ